MMNMISGLFIIALAGSVNQAVFAIRNPLTGAHVAQTPAWLRNRLNVFLLDAALLLAFAFGAWMLWVDLGRWPWVVIMSIVTFYGHGYGAFVSLAAVLYYFNGFNS